VQNLFYRSDSGQWMGSKGIIGGRRRVGFNLIGSKTWLRKSVKTSLSDLMIRKRGDKMIQDTNLMR
jgi:hypothetical protein